MISLTDETGSQDGSAAFSACNDKRDRTDAVTNVSMNYIKPDMHPRIGHRPEIGNKIRMHPFSVPTEQIVNGVVVDRPVGYPPYNGM